MNKRIKKKVAIRKCQKSLEKMKQICRRTPTMNRRIRKKKDKKITEAINGLVSIAERREQQRQAAIRQFVKRCEALYEQQRKERRN